MPIMCYSGSRAAVGGFGGQRLSPK